MSDDVKKTDGVPLTRRKAMTQAMAKVSLFALTAGLGVASMATHAHAGAGRCSVPGCPCPEFMPEPGNSYMCANCGHNYSLHW